MRNEFPKQKPYTFEDMRNRMQGVSVDAPDNETPVLEKPNVDRISQMRKERDAAIRERGDRLKEAFGKVIDKISGVELKISESVESSQKKIRETIVKGKEGYESGRKWVLDRFKSGVRYIEVQGDAAINKAYEFSSKVVDKIDITFQKIQLQKEVFEEDRKNFVDSLESKAVQAMQIATSLLKANVERAGDSGLITKAQEALVVQDSRRFAKDRTKIRREIAKIDEAIQEQTDFLSSLETSTLKSEGMKRRIQELKGKINLLVEKKAQLGAKMSEVQPASSVETIEQIQSKIEEFGNLLQAMVEGIDKTRTGIQSRIDERNKLIKSIRQRAKAAKVPSIDILGVGSNQEI